MPVHQNKTLDPGHFVIVKPLTIRPPVGMKLQAWSSGKHGASEPNREQVFRGSYHRRQQLSQQSYRRPFEETVKPVFGSLKRVDEKARNGWSAPDPVVSTAILKPTGRCKSAMREDSRAIKSHLCHVRRLMSGVMQGRGYFHLLQREEQELQEARKREQRKREVKQRTECQPPCYDSDSDTESAVPSESPHRAAISAGGSWASTGRVRRKKLPAARPFTPVYHSLSSPQLGSVALEPVFRQLCCLNWLLEAVTLNPPGRTGPVSSCWDMADPGRSRMTVKALNKEKAIEMRWDQFISQPKPRRATSRGLSSFLGRPLRRASLLSLASSSATSPTLRSLSSLALGPDEAPPPGGAAASEDWSLQGPGDPRNKATPSEFGQKLDTRSQSAVSELPRPKQHSDDLFDGSPQGQLSAVSQLVKSKSSMLEEIQTSFQERTQELALSLNTTLESRARNRWDNGVLTYEALRHGVLTPPRSRPVTVTSGTRSAAGRPSISRPCEDGVWLSRLIADLPEAVVQDWRVGRLLEKLRRFADGRSLRILPSAFLKVLGTLQPWELCSPDLCVAIEIVREHVVQMTAEEYDLWLQSRVTLPKPAWSDLPRGGVR